MQVIVCPDSFKECLSAVQVVLAIERGVKRALPQAEVQRIPMADGGEGSLQTLVEHTGGRFIEVEVCDPLLRPIAARYGVLGDGETVVIESASAVGLALLKKEERNPFITSTYGVGQLIAHAVKAGYKKIVVCLGGSATNDGGAGMLQALGCGLLNQQGNPVGAGNAALAELTTIDASPVQELLNGCSITVACDVSNVLCGEQGASFTFARQKGAAENDLQPMDDNLKRYANVVKQTLGKNYSEYQGAGAAGGLGFALMAFANAKMKKGVELIADLLGLKNAIAQSDIVFTGEGSIDAQTSFGKVPFGVASMAKEFGVPIVALCGRRVGAMSALHDAGITAIFSIADSPMSLGDSMKNAEILLEQQAEEAMRLFICRNS